MACIFRGLQFPETGASAQEWSFPISYPSHPYGSNVLPCQNVHYLAHGFLEDCCGFYAHFVWMRGPCRARELKLYEGGLRQA